VRARISITISEELLRRLDRLDRDRSAVFERAAQIYVSNLERQARDRRDREIIDRNVDRLNREAIDTLGYQQLQ